VQKFEKIYFFVRRKEKLCAYCVHCTARFFKRFYLEIKGGWVTLIFFKDKAQTFRCLWIPDARLSIFLFYVALIKQSRNLNHWMNLNENYIPSIFPHFWKGATKCNFLLCVRLMITWYFWSYCVLSVFYLFVDFFARLSNLYDRDRILCSK